MKVKEGISKNILLSKAIICAVAGMLAFSVQVVVAKQFQELLDQPRDLFRDVAVASQSTGSATMKTATIRSRPVVVDFKLLTQLKKGIGKRVGLNLFPDVNFVGVVERIEEGLHGAQIFYGELVDREYGSFIIVVVDEAMAASIRIPGEEVYQVHLLKNSLHVIRQVDESQLLPCGVDSEHMAQMTPSQTFEAGSVAQPLMGSVGDPLVFDVLVVYTPKARNSAGGTAGMLSRIQLAVANGNLAYQNSLIGPRLRLIHTAEVSYTESDSSSTDLSRLKNKNDGYMDEVHIMRNTYGADMVSLVAWGLDVCGRAYQMTEESWGFHEEAFSIVNIACLESLTFVHELGHNIGCTHDRDNAGVGVFDYSFGYRNPSQTWRTVMAYSPGTRIPYFSNPEVLYQGEPTGIPQGQPDSADNALSINNVADTVISWRPSHVHDCNGNGVYDHEDITNGTSPDINYNGVPDECETRIYVDDDAAGANDGTSWTDAHNNLQDALAHALSSFETMNSVTEIWVAAGTYKPDGPGGDRFKSFNLLNNLAIYGGFAGTETELEQRNPTSYVSILSGDLNGDDGPDFSNNDENSCHVVTSIFVPSTILDGFTITGGNADGSGATSGGGMYCRQSSPMIANCIFKDNYAWSEGGGIYNYECSPILSNCMFVGNSARGDGGGLHSIRSNATVIKCVFYDNSADDGGAMGNTLSDTTVINCKFQGNSASQRGGAIYNFECNPKFTNCAFVVNSAQSEGGGVCNSSDSNSILTNCTLYGNSAQIRGGGICNYSYNCHPLLTSCILWNNVAGGVSDESAQCGGYAPVANYCCVQGLTGLWGGVGNIGDDPIFVDPDGIDNDPNTWGDNDYHLSDGSPCIDAGDNTSLPPDEADLDGDGNTIEQTPFDLEDNQRFWDDPNTIDSGNPGAPGSPITDMGAYEFISPLHTPGDFNHDGDVDQEDFGIFQACISGSGSLYAPGCADADLDKDSDVDLNDFTIFQSCMAGPNQPSGC